jgi:hypothetical protein
MSMKILLFDRQGKFIRQISRPGQGPGEYIRPNDVSINPDEELIYVTTQKQVNHYRITGEFVKYTPLPSWALYVEPFGDDLLGIFPSYYSTLVDNYTFIFLKEDGTPKEKLLKREWDFLKPRDPIKFARFYWFDGLLCYNEAYYDTVYAITPDRQVIPRIAFSGSNRDQDPMTATGFVLHGWRELPGYIFLTGTETRLMTNLIYDRRTGEIWRVPYNHATDQSGITNDLDGGLGYWPGKLYKGKTFNLEYGFRMKSEFDDLAGKPFIAKLPERRKQLEQFIAGLTDEDNQILTIVTLKK